MTPLNILFLRLRRDIRLPRLDAVIDAEVQGKDIHPWKSVSSWWKSFSITDTIFNHELSQETNPKHVLRV
jgi:hypothetical protein